MHARDLIHLLGGQSALAQALGRGQSTVAYWAKTGTIPAKWHSAILEIADQQGVDLSHDDFDKPTIKIMPASMKHNKNKHLHSNSESLPATQLQGRLDLGIDKQKELDGIGMGVLTDGTAFLTGRGLARLAGVHHSQIQDIGNEFDAPVSTPRADRIRDILASHGENPKGLFIPIQQRSGLFFAYPDYVCAAVLEYYAFDAAHRPPEAVQNFRLLAGRALRDFIYTQVGYDPNENVPEPWRQFHDRVSLTYNSVPAGYFGIFKEMADMIVTLGQSGLHIDSGFVPDISVGIHWGKHWSANRLNETYGERVRFEHNYPSYFPQSASNPQEPWCYPEAALGEFRRWLRETYIGEGRFKTYIEKKARDKELPISFAQLAIAAYAQ